MGRISKTIQALYGGVSQQAPGLRLETQVTESVNMLPHVTHGLVRRPPTAHKARVDFPVSSGWDPVENHLRTYVHKIDKSSAERYCVIFTAPEDGGGTPVTEIRVLDLDGAELPVIYDTTAAQDYIEACTTHGAGGNLRAVTVLDATFIANTSVTPAMTAALSRWGENLVQSKYSWLPSGSGTNEYYVRLTSGTTLDLDEDGVPEALTYDPNLTRPEEVLENGTQIPSGTLGSLAAGEWGYGDNDTLGYSTIYVRLTDGADPDTKASEYVFAKPTTKVAFIVTRDGNRNNAAVEVDGKGASVYPPDGLAFRMAEAAASAVSNIGGGLTSTYLGAGSSGTVLRITKEVAGANVDFSMKVTEQPNLRMVKSVVNKFTDLPIRANDGDILEVRGEVAKSDARQYYVRYDEETSRWVESLPDGLSYKIDPTTMPHKMTRQVDDGLGTVTGTPNQVYFFVEAIDWTDRAVGDDSSNPLPSFIGTPIEDIFFYQDRLGFLAGENVILSQTKEYFNFFSQTSTDTLDDDPIDVTIGGSSQVTLKWAFPFADSLEIMGNNRQFSIHSGLNNPALTPQNVVVSPTTKLTLLPDVRPGFAGDSLFLLSPSGQDFCQLFRYHPNSEGVSTAVSLTKHAPRYIQNYTGPEDPLASSFGGYPSNIGQIEVCQDEGLVFLLQQSAVTYVNGVPAQTYVYSYLENGGELIQSAIHRWIIPATAVWIFGDTCRWLTYRESEVPASFGGQCRRCHLESQIFSIDGNIDEYESSPSRKAVYLDDFLATTDASVTTGSNPSSVQFSWNIPNSTEYSVILDPGTAHAVRTVSQVNSELTAGLDGFGIPLYTQIGPSSVTGSGPYTYTFSDLANGSAPDWVGFSYESYVTMTPPAVQAGGQRISSGTLIHLLGSVVVSPLSSGSIKTYRRGTLLSTLDFTRGQIFAIPFGVQCNALDSVVSIYSTEVNALQITDYSWVANFVNHTRSI